LLSIQRQVVTQHTRSLFCRDFGHQRDVVQQRGDIVDQYQ